MTEKTPIKAKDIQVGDLIRIEYAKEEAASEYRVTLGTVGMNIIGKPFLLDRPVVLPTVPGVYRGLYGHLIELIDGQFTVSGCLLTTKQTSDHLPLERLMTATEWEGGK